MTYTLRPYQDQAVRTGIQFFNDRSKENAIMVLPTGSGKSLVIASIAKELPGNTLIFQPSKEILEQNYEKLSTYGYHASIYSASLNSKQIGKITFATIGSAINKKELFDSFQHIIIDECHLVNPKGGVYQEFIANHKAKVLGLSATPYRLVTDGFGGSILKFITRTRPRIFHDVIYYVQNGQLFQEGYLAKMEYRTVNGYDTKQIKKNSTGADFDEDSLRSYHERVSHQKRILQVVEYLKDRRKGILVFNTFIAEAEYMASQFPGSAFVTSETKPAERKRIISEFRAGNIKVVFNVGVLAVGFDYPELDTVILARPTMSLALYYQMIGRAIRPHPNKERALVVDMCDSYKRFGKIEDLRLVENNNKPYIASGYRQLTNIYYDQIQEAK